MRLRLTLAAALLASAAPLAGPSHASACNDQMFPEVCAAITQVCQSTSATRTACGLFQ